MTSHFVPLSQLLRVQRNHNSIVAVRNNKNLTWTQFRNDIHTLYESLQQDNNSNWGLYHPDSYTFAVGLIALLAAGKTIYIPANNTIGTQNLLAEQCNRFIGKFESDSVLEIPIMEISNNCKWPEKAPLLTGTIVVFTSGSSGKPKAIHKSIEQLSTEAYSHHNMWRELFDDAHFMASVTHQHFYGLSFKLLLPLCAQYVFHSEVYLDPCSLLEQACQLVKAVWIGSPAQFKRINDAWPFEQANSHLQAIFSSGGPLPPDTAEKLLHLMKFPVTEIYGSSETGAVAWRRYSDTTNNEWTPLPDITTKVNSSGALLIRSPFLPDNNWHTMGDSAKIYSNDRFILGSRLDRIVKIEEKRISLAEIEDELTKLPEINRCIAIPLKRRRQIIGVASELTESGRNKLQQDGKLHFVRYLRDQLSKFFEPTTIPRSWRFIDQIPFDTQDKLNMTEISSLFEDNNQDKIVLPKIINSVVTDGVLNIQLSISDDLAFFPGHFPEVPILPGLIQITWAEYYASRNLPLQGNFIGIQNLKFKKMIKPGMDISLEIEYKLPKNILYFRFYSDAGEHSSGRMLFG